MDKPQSAISAAEAAPRSTPRKPWTAPLVITSSESRNAAKSFVSAPEHHSFTSTNCSS